ncbi:MAG: hypothetical protein ABFS56_15550 [Pseudomonadota bacterium]
MRWKINRSVYTPLTILPYPQRHYPAILQLEPLFTTTKEQSALGALLGDSHFDLRCTESWEEASLCPWRSFLGDPNPTELKNAYCVEAAIALRVIDVSEFREVEPLSPGKIYHQLTKTNFPENLQEAFAFALFDLKAPLLDKLPVLEDWKNDVRRVIHERENLARLCNPDSVLLSHGYQLLELISQQRQSPPVPEEWLKAWDNFKQQATIDLPLIFAIVYWRDAVERLTDMGAEMLLEKQQRAVDELLALLPHLSL